LKGLRLKRRYSKNQAPQKTKPLLVSQQGFAFLEAWQ
jgi:hypothetical protein